MDNEEKIRKLNEENEKLRMELQTIKERMEIYNSQPKTNSGISRGCFIQNREENIHPTRQRRASTPQYNTRKMTRKIDYKPTSQQKKEYFWIFFCCKKRTKLGGIT